MRLPAILALAVACGGSSTEPAEPAPASPEAAQPAAGDAPATPPAGPTDQQTGPSWGDTSVCTQRADQFGPITLDARQATGRYGHGSTRFDQILSSKERPVEVCGTAGELDWLFSTSCADGSHPFADRAAAHGARRGSVGGGGRCGSVIDAYDVPCPEKRYEVYLDMYMCGPGESID
jgi:hypothetical protein